MKIINYLKSLLYFFIPLITLLFILTIFYYFNLLSCNIIKYLKIIIVILSSFISGYKIGNLSTNKGYLKGIILSIIIIFIFFIISLITNKLNLSLIIYYLIIGITITLGSIIGINKNNRT